MRKRFCGLPWGDFTIEAVRFGLESLISYNRNGFDAIRLQGTPVLLIAACRSSSDAERVSTFAVMP